MGKRIVAVHLTGRDAGIAVAEASLRSLRIVELARAPLPPAGSHLTVAERAADLVVASLPATAVLFRMLEFPFGDRRRLDQAVGPSLEEHLPLTLDDCRSAYDIARDERPYRVLAGMVPQQQFDEQLRRLESVGLAPARLVWAPTAALSAYAAVLATRGGGAFVIHCDGDSVVVAALVGGSLHGLRVHPMCEHKRLARNVAWTIRTLETDARDVLIGGVGADELAPVLAEALPAKAVSLAGAEAPPVELPETEDWTLHATALGLALSAGGESRAPTLAFSTGSESTASPSARRAELRPLAGWALAACVLAASAFAMDTVRLSRRTHALEAEADRIVGQVLPSAAGAPGRRIKLELRAAELDRRLNAGGAPSGISALGTLAALSQAVPKQVAVEFDFYLYDPPEVRVRGHGDDFEDVTKLERALEGSEAVESVEANNVRAAVSGAGVDFDITIRLATGEARS